MKHLAAVSAALALLALPAAAQDEAEEGLSLMERGAQIFMEGIRREMEPALDDLQGLAQEARPALRDFLREMGPAMAEILADIQDLSAYHPPEMLPNGDIILRKKVPDEPPEAEPGGEVEI